MENNLQIAVNVDEYIAQFPSDVQVTMKSIRTLVKETVPGSTEKISWGMPTFVHNGIVIQFAGHKGHIGLYPGPKAIEVFSDELKELKTTKGGIQLPYGTDVPYDTIRRIIEFNDNERTIKKK